MSGGLQQLVAFGAQDVYLTGNPQITFFKSIYKRHTNFSCESIKQVHNGNAGFGQTIQCNIARQGDLANKMYLQVTVDALSVDKNAWTSVTGASSFTDANVNIAWVKRLGFSLIDYVELEIGGSRIDKQYGQWLDLWYELTHTQSQEAGYRKMLGDVPEMTSLATPNSSTGVAKDQYTMFIPLQFFFCRHDGQSLPLIALQYHDVKITIKFAAANKQVVWTGANTLSNAHIAIQDVNLWVDYIYLDSQERHRFAKVPHEYLIEQIQFTGSESITQQSSNLISQKTSLRFNHPTKELVWALRVGAFNGDGLSSNASKCKFLCYTDDDNWDLALEYAAFNLANSMIEVVTVKTIGTTYGTTAAVDDDTNGIYTGNTETVIKPLFAASNETPALFTGSSTIYTFNYKDATAGKTFKKDNVSFDLYVQFQDTLGNLITDADASYGQFATDTTDGARYIPIIKINPKPLSQGNFNLADGISIIDLVIELTADEDNENIVADKGAAKKTSQLSVISHSLSLDDVSIPIDQWTDTRLSTDKMYDVAVIQHHNYGLRLDGAGNPCADVKLQFNSNDRFTTREGPYFNNVQPFQHHTRNPVDGVNVYSFALKPELYQPTGTANLSRIDSVVLQITFKDVLRYSKDVPQLNISNNSKFFVFALSYNVLRIISGMGGLAYSN